MSQQPAKLPFEEAAELRSVSVWVCKTCRKDYSTEGERMARLCCAKDIKCGTAGCDARVAKHAFIDCKECRDKKDAARWAAYPEVPWDGETPLCIDGDDRFFFSFQDLDEFFLDNELTRDDVRLVICVPETKPRFDVSDLVEDYLADGMDLQARGEEILGIEKTVTDWLADHLQQMWYPGKTRPTLESVK